MKGTARSASGPYQCGDEQITMAAKPSARKHDLCYNVRNETDSHNEKDVMAKPKIVICMGSSCFARGNEKTVEACESFMAERGLKDEVDVAKISGTSDMKRVMDLKGNPLLLFAHEWSIRTVMERNKGLELAEFSKN